MKRAIYITIVAVAMIITGCAASGPSFKKVTEVPSGKALIYIYRPDLHEGGAYTPDVKIEGHVEFPLRNGGYFPHLSTPGTVKISISNTGSFSLTIDAAAGETYFVKGGLVRFGFGVPYIISVPVDVGQEEIKECKLLTDFITKKGE